MGGFVPCGACWGVSCHVVEDDDQQQRGREATPAARSLGQEQQGEYEVAATGER